MAAKRHHAKMSKAARHEISHEIRHEMRDSDRRDDIRWAEYYAGVDPRRRQEMIDGSMIREDHAAIANMPQRVVYREYPRVGETVAPYLDDTIEGVDRQMNRDDMMKRKIFSPRKV